MIAVSLAGCVSSNQPIQPQLSAPAADPTLAVCFKRAFPEIPDRALTGDDVVRIVRDAKALDRIKTACGARAVKLIERHRQIIKGTNR